MATIDITGEIVSDEDGKIYERWNFQVVYPQKIKDALKEAKGEAVDININSGGGNLFAANEIYGALQAYGGEVNIHVVGMAASAASVIMCAGHCDIVPAGVVMVHRASMRVGGNANDMGKAAEVLGTIDRAIANAYIAKTGMSEAEALAMMDKETWHTAAEAIKLGLCDGYFESKNTPAQRSDKKAKTTNAAAKAKAQAQFKFLNLKGDK